MSTQQQAERDMAVKGRLRYRRKRDKAFAKKAATTIPSVRIQLQESVHVVQGELGAWRRRVARQGYRRADVFGIVNELLRGVPAERVAIVACKAILDCMLSGSSSTLAAAAVWVGSRIEDELHWIWAQRNHEQLLKHTKVTVGKGKSPARLMKELARQEKAQGHIWKPWTTHMRAQCGGLMVEMFRQGTGLIEVVDGIRNLGDLKRARRPTQTLVPTQEFLEWIRQSDERHEMLFPEYGPCVVPPKPWEGLWDGGYRYDEFPPLCFITSRKMGNQVRKAMQSALAEADLSEVFGGVNAIQKTPWSVCEPVLETMQHFWSMGIGVGKLPATIVEEEPVFPQDGTKLEQRDFYVERDEVRKRNQENAGRAIGAASVLGSADKHRGQRIWYPYRTDWRGRVYAIPSGLSPQGNDLSKGLLEFSDGLEVGDEEGADWLRIGLANLAGNDKLPFHERVEWTLAHEDEIRAVGEDPLSYPDFWIDADNGAHAWSFLQACIDYTGFLEQGYKWKSKVYISQDCSCSGMQIFSLLLRDKVGAHWTNVTPGDAPRDLYSEVGRVAYERLGELAFTEEYAQKCLAFLGGQIPRSWTKRPTMTIPYGLTKFSCLDYLIEEYREEVRRRSGVTNFEGAGYKELAYLRNVIWEAIFDVVSSAREAMEWLQGIGASFASQGLALTWDSPSGFRVRQEYRKKDTRRVRNAFGTSVRRKATPNAWKQFEVRYDTEAMSAYDARKASSPNFIHSLDAACMHKIAFRADQAGIRDLAMNHDCFGTHCSQTKQLRDIVRETYSEVFTVNLLEDFKRQVEVYGVKVPETPEIGDLDPRCVLESEYLIS